MHRPPGTAERYLPGTELCYRTIRAFRGGYSMHSAELRWSAGIGLKLCSGVIGQRIDSDFTASDYLGRVDRISAGVKF